MKQKAEQQPGGVGLLLCFGETSERKSCDSNSSFDLVLAGQRSRQARASFSGLLQTRYSSPFQVHSCFSYSRATSAHFKTREIPHCCDLQNSPFLSEQITRLSDRIADQTADAVDSPALVWPFAFQRHEPATGSYLRKTQRQHLHHQRRYVRDRSRDGSQRLHCRRIGLAPPHKD